MEPLGKVGGAAFITAIVDEKVRQFELKFLARLEEAYNKPPPPPPPSPPSFFVAARVGTFIWSCISNLVTSLFVIWFVHACCKFGDFIGVARALQDISDHMCRKGSLPAAGGPDPGVDIQEAAHALASPGVREATVADIRSLENEMCIRKKLWTWLKGCISQKQKRGDDTLPVTNGDTLSTAGHASGDCINHSGVPSSPSALADTGIEAVFVGMNLGDTTITAQQANGLQTQAAKCLPSHTQDYRVESGSTFLSATVLIAASAMEDLLHRAVSLLKMGSDLDKTCTVQLGYSAILYNSTAPGVTVGSKLLKKGVHDVPIVTSAQKFGNRTIVIKGSYLENADIKTTTSIYGESTHLCVLYHQKLENGVEVLLAQLPRDNLLQEQIMVYGTKTIQMEGCSHPLVLRCKAKEIDINKRNTSIFGALRAIRFWICFFTLCIYQVTSLWTQQWLLMEKICQTIIFLFSYFLVEYIINPWTFGLITRGIETKVVRKNLHHVLASIDPHEENLLADENSDQDLLRSACLERDVSNTTHTSQDERSDSDEESNSLSAFFARMLHRPHDELSDSGFSTIIETDRDQRGPVNVLDWEWPCYEHFLREGRWVTQPAAAKKFCEEETANKPFEEMKTVHQDGTESVELIVRSPLLIQVLKSCEPKTDMQFVEGSRIPPTELFLRRDSLESYVARNSGQTDGSAAAPETSLWHVKHLLRFIGRHFADALVQYERMKTEGCVSFEMLWAFFVPGEGVCRRCLVTNQESFAIVKRPAKYKCGTCCLTLHVMDFNARSYFRCAMKYMIDHFEGEVPFTSLQVCPLLFFSNHRAKRAHFISVGNIFYQVAMQQPFRFMQFKGSINFYQSEGGCLRLRKFHSDGRVMIDLMSFARRNPDYPLKNAEPPCEVMTGMWTRDEHMKKPTDEELMLAPAFAYGFSFRLKKWGCFELCGLQEISFNQGAFDALKMKSESQKKILESVVQQYIVSRDGSSLQNHQSIDPIGTKGTGCVVLCHGPPGTGKTLTAEALAETLQCPLWSISAFELGSEPETVEVTLSQIMEIAYNWGAVLLLDEADAYLERRDEGVDVKRNLLTGVFLRVLEYYRGIMFLTTNRVTVFDDAILSRTTLAVSYTALDDTQRREIWKKLLNNVGIHDATYDALLQHDLNGRQIRNIVHLAQLLARGHKQTLQIRHVFDAMDSFIAGTEELPTHLLPAPAAS